MLVPSRFRAEHVSLRSAYVAEGGSLRPMSQRLDIVLLRSDHTELPVDIALSTLKLDDEKFVITTLRDASVRRQAEVAVEHERSLLAAMNQISIELLEGHELDSTFRTIVAHARRARRCRLRRADRAERRRRVVGDARRRRRRFTRARRRRRAPRFVDGGRGDPRPRAAAPRRLVDRLARVPAAGLAGRRRTRTVRAHARRRRDARERHRGAPPRPRHVHRGGHRAGTDLRRARVGGPRERPAPGGDPAVERARRGPPHASQRRSTTPSSGACRACHSGSTVCCGTISPRRPRPGSGNRSTSSTPRSGRSATRSSRALSPPRPGQQVPTIRGRRPLRRRDASADHRA